MDELFSENGNAGDRKARIDGGTDRPVPLQVNPDHITEELRRRQQWVCWRHERRDVRWTKVPYQYFNAR